MNQVPEQFRGASAAQSGETGAPPGGQSGPQVGAVEDGYEFLGGDPADQNSWRRVQ